MMQNKEVSSAGMVTPVRSLLSSSSFGVGMEGVYMEYMTCTTYIILHTYIIHCNIIYIYIYTYIHIIYCAYCMHHVFCTSWVGVCVNLYTCIVCAISVHIVYYTYNLCLRYVETGRYEHHVGLGVLRWRDWILTTMIQNSMVCPYTYTDTHTLQPPQWKVAGPDRLLHAPGSSTSYPHVRPRSFPRACTLP